MMLASHMRGLSTSRPRRPFVCTTTGPYTDAADYLPDVSRWDIRMKTDEFIGGRTWLVAGTVKQISDIALGGIAIAAATIALANINRNPFGHWDRLNEWFFPTVVGGLLAIVAFVLMLRGAAFGGVHRERWRIRDMLIIAAAVVAASLAGWQWGWRLLLQMGPSDLVMLMLFELAIAIALARASRLRALTMLLLGLLLGTVGTDVETGVARFTMGVDELVDGIGTAIAALGLVVVTDGILCLVSPRLFVESYARQIAEWTAPSVLTIVSVCLRILAAIAIAAASYYSYTLNASTWDVSMLFVFGAFGVACRIFGWNRLLLILALAWSPLLEEDIRRAMLISRGDPAIFIRWPFGGSLLLMICAILVLLAVASTRQATRRGAKPA